MRLRPALLLVDFFHPDNYHGLKVGPGEVVRAAAHARHLQVAAEARGIPSIYVNDNFGAWADSFQDLVGRASAGNSASAAVARELAPRNGEAFVLKPRHSAFYGTPLEFLLEQLRCNALILTGITTESCISMTANDGHVRGFALWIPANCVASASPGVKRAALRQLRRVTQADTRTWPRS